MFRRIAVVCLIICFLSSLIGCSSNFTFEQNESIAENQISEEDTLSIPVNSDNDFTYTIEGNTVKIIKYIGEKNMVGIPSTIEGVEVTTIGMGAFDECRNVTAVHIPDSISTIGQHAFYCCSNLTDIIIPNSVTTIGHGAFQGCSNLKRINIPNNLSTIQTAVFENCSSLESITIPESVIDIARGSFCGCNSLKQIKVDKDNPVYSSYDGDLYNKEKTTLIRFSAGKSTIDFSPCITEIGDAAFNRCDNIIDVTIPDTVTSIGEKAFYCKNLTNITISSGVTYMGKFSFSNCDKLTDVTILDGATAIGERAFQSCDNLSNVYIPDSITDIEYYSFLDCDNLVITCHRNSYAEEYAIQHDISVSYKD